MTRKRVAIAAIISLVTIGIGVYALAAREPHATPQTAPSDPTAAKLQAFYEAYVQNPSSGARRSYLTPELAAQFDAKTTKGDPVLCSSLLPRAVMVAPVAGQAADAGGFTVTETFTTGSDIQIMVAVRMSDGLITSITCP